MVRLRSPSFVLRFYSGRTLSVVECVRIILSASTLLGMVRGMVSHVEPQVNKANASKDLTGKCHGTFTKTEQEESAQLDVFQQVSDICALVATAISEEDLLEKSLQRTMQLVGATRGSIFLLDSSGKDLTLKIAIGLKKDEQKQMVKKMGRGSSAMSPNVNSPSLSMISKRMSVFMTLRPAKATGRHHLSARRCSSKTN